MAEPILPSVRAPFRAIASVVVPEIAGLDDEGWLRLERLVEDALATRSPAQRRQVRLFVRALDLLPLVRWGCRFTALSADRRARLLTALQNAPVLLLRRGVWALRTLVYLGYYGQPEVRRSIGYSAHPLGWEALTDAAAGRSATGPPPDPTP